jgi:DNA-binding MarR family transcriptional regulator
VSDEELQQRARGQITVLEVRQRLAPPAVISEFSWHVMLEVFCCGAGTFNPDLSAYAERWQLSEITMARKIAALVEYGLIRRFSDNQPLSGPPSPHGWTLSLGLTNKGRSLVKAVLGQAK